MTTYPEDEIEEEEHVFNTFRAAINANAHGVGFSKGCFLSRLTKKCLDEASVTQCSRRLNPNHSGCVLLLLGLRRR